MAKKETEPNSSAKSAEVKPNVQPVVEQKSEKEEKSVLPQDLNEVPKGANKMLWDFYQKNRSLAGRQWAKLTTSVGELSFVVSPLNQGAQLGVKWTPEGSKGVEIMTREYLANLKQQFDEYVKIMEKMFDNIDQVYKNGLNGKKKRIVSEEVFEFQ